MQQDADIAVAETIPRLSWLEHGGNYENRLFSWQELLEKLKIRKLWPPEDALS